MDLSDPKTELHFSQTIRQIVLMLLVLALVASGGTLAAPRVLPVFEANPYPVSYTHLTLPTIVDV